MTDFDGASQQFLAWLEQTGTAINPKIALRDLRASHCGRGVVAVQNIEEDELLFRVPRSCILSVENSILSKEIPKATLEYLGPWLSLILVMLYEYKNDSASNWAPYFRVLPTEFNTLMFWEEDELDKLQASAVRDKIGKEEADETFRTQLVPVIQEFADVFFCGDEHAKARAEEMRSPENLQLMHVMGTLIMAYAFDVEPAVANKEVDEEGYASEDEDEALPKGMVPLADMLNADADRNNARLFYEEEFLSMKAIKPIHADEEIFNDYGALPRSDLLRRYGYITDNYAQYDVVEIPHELVIQQARELAPPTFGKRIDYLDEQGVVDSGYDIATSEPFNIQESVSEQLIVLVQALLLPDAEFERLAKSEKLPKPKNMTATDAECLRRIVKARTEQYPTSLEQDLSEPVRAPTTGPYMSKERRYAMARLVRIGEKKILRSAEEALAGIVNQLSSNGAGKRGRQDNLDVSDRRQKARR
ncbi:SET domain-containing protein [Sporormia fimetaria CBS 119925]|uniref:SET domain-containing protein n=1 Tax=Sporormia fimetaria CBS 119925 TaxID=1340428 RepID=A0A6A6VC74_9PLEO|nr:SET domain-containing protein [Sporormia fimetaria CBS 119925]